MYCAEVGEKTNQHQLFQTQEPVLHKPGTLNIIAFPTASPSLTDVCHVSLKLFCDKLAVDTSLISSYKYNNRSLPRLSPFYICNNQLYPMQRADCTNVFLYCIPKMNFKTSNTIFFSDCFFSTIFFESVD